MKQRDGFEQLSSQGKVYHEIINFYDQRIIGQDHAKKLIAQRLANSHNDISGGDGPLGVFLLTGPTGVGKTMIVHETARLLFGDPDAVNKIECELLQEDHNSSRLFGAPPGYIGFERTPFLDPNRVFSPFKRAKEQGRLHPIVGRHQDYAIILFDELEKMHANIAQKLLNITGSKKIELMNGKVLNTTNCWIFFTSNIGEHEAQQTRSSIGFGNTSTPLITTDLKRKALERKFSPEFIGRIQDTIEFGGVQENFLHQLISKYQDEMKQLLAIHLEQDVSIDISPEAHHHIIQMINTKYGMRNAKLFRTNEIEKTLGSILKIYRFHRKRVEKIYIDVQDGEIVFFGKFTGKKRGQQHSPIQQTETIPLLTDGVNSQIAGILFVLIQHKKNR